MVAPRKLYTPNEANRTLPLVRAITKDIRDIALRMRATWDRIQHLGSGRQSEREKLEDAFEDDRQALLQMNNELEQLGVELKDPVTGLVDFRAQRGADEVYLCWRLGEDQIDHWHQLEAGFTGRQPLATF